MLFFRYVQFTCCLEQVDETCCLCNRRVGYVGIAFLCLLHCVTCYSMSIYYSVIHPVVFYQILVPIIGGIGGFVLLYLMIYYLYRKDLTVSDIEPVHPHHKWTQLTFKSSHAASSGCHAYFRNQ